MRRGGTSVRTDSWRLVVGLVFVVIATGGGLVVSAGETCDLVTQLAANDGETSGEFGRTTALDDDLAVIGAEGDDSNGTNSGSAYVFRFDGIDWMQEQKLIPADARAFHEFATAVSIAGDTIAIGVPQDDDLGVGAGAAYIFRFDGSAWVEDQKLLASDGQAGDTFGESIEIYDGTLVIGAPGASAVYVWATDGSLWSEQQKLTPGASGDSVGLAVAIADDVILVAAESDDEPEPGSGAVYAFRLEGSIWVQEQELRPTDGTVSLSFGNSVAVAGDTALVGAPGFNVETGSAYVFKFDGSSWIQQQRILASDGVERDLFGTAVSVSADLALVSSVPALTLTNTPGAVYVYRYNGSTWLEDQILVDADGTKDDLFGFSVSLDTDMGLVGAFLAEGIAPVTGAAFVFQSVVAADCNSNEIPDSCELLKGLSDDCNENDVPDECDLVPTFFSASGQLSPLDAGLPQSFVLESPPEAVSEVTLDFTASADLDHVSEWVIVDINGTFVGSIFVSQAEQCPTAPDTEQIVLDALTYNDILGGGNAVITMVATSGVDQECDSTSYIALTVEYEPSNIDPDCNDNSVPDDCDLAQGSSADCNDNGTPDECEADCNENGAPDDCDLTSGTSADCNANSTPDECDIASGSSSDCDGNEIPDECDPDCNSNGTPDDCDIAGGTSLDCNSNGQPDECDIESGVSDDCNMNGVPDLCDIADGTSNDSNENGIPDECDPCAGDANGDGVVDPLDAGFVLARFGCSYPEDGENCQAADVNGDGTVDPLDSGFVLARFGPCP